jgi:hypothetical protein
LLRMKSFIETGHQPHDATQRKAQAAWEKTSAFITRMPPLASAPIASSDWPGVPSLRTMNTSSGARKARATSAATGTPPRASPNTTTSLRPAYSFNRSASSLPAFRVEREQQAQSFRLRVGYVN